MFPRNCWELNKDALGRADAEEGVKLLLLLLLLLWGGEVEEREEVALTEDGGVRGSCEDVWLDFKNAEKIEKNGTLSIVKCFLSW